MQTDRDVELIQSYHTQLKKWLKEKHNAGGDEGLNPKFLAATLKFNKRVDEIDASRNLTHCLNKMNRKLFGKNGNKKGKRLKVIPAMETKGRIHFHLFIKIPEGRTFKEIRELLIWNWRGTKFGSFKYNHTRSNADEGWLEYITKFENLADDIDFMNIEF